jgi:hypothetical protein
MFFVGARRARPFRRRAAGDLAPAGVHRAVRVKLVSADAEELHAEFGDLLSDVDRR